MFTMSDTYPTPDAPDPRDQLVKVVDELGERTRKIGLYYQGSSIGCEDPETAEKFSSGQLTAAQVIDSGHKIVVIAGFTIGDLAFSKEVQDPDQAKFDRAAQEMLPTEAEMMRDRIRKALEEGKDVTAIFDEPDEES